MLDNKSRNIFLWVLAYTLNYYFYAAESKGKNSDKFILKQFYYHETIYNCVNCNRFLKLNAHIYDRLLPSYKEKKKKKKREKASLQTITVFTKNCYKK